MAKKNHKRIRIGAFDVTIWDINDTQKAVLALQKAYEKIVLRE